jgi:perosamine synthetase
MSMPPCYYIGPTRVQAILTLMVAPQNSGQIPAGFGLNLPVQTNAQERIPKDPVLSLATFTRLSASDVNAIPCVLDVGAVRFVNRGCMAIGLALQDAQVGAGDEVLMPAYHCISMVEPVLWRNADAVFYRVNADTSVDLSDIEAKITSRTRALLVAHYFGFPQNMARIRALCDVRKLLLIEDCAHAFFGSVDQAPLGSYGDYAIASTWKFFPSPEGGLLVSARRELNNIALQKPGLRFQAKTMVNALEHALAYRRFPVFGPLIKVPLILKDWTLRILNNKSAKAPLPWTPAQTSADEKVSPASWGFDPVLVSQQMSVFSQWIAVHASKQRIVESRRANYVRLLKEFSQLSGCRPLFPTLPAEIVPHVFPLLIDNPDPVFHLLKRQGVPIIRFGEYLWPAMPRTLCTVSADLSRRVFQFPCHQDLLPEELEWMIGCIRTTLRQPHAAGA